MIEKTIQELKEAEKLAEDRINQAKEQEYAKSKEFRMNTDKEWEQVNNDLNNLKKDIIKKYEDEAAGEVTNIQKTANEKEAVLEQLALKKAVIIDSIIKNLLKE